MAKLRKEMLVQPKPEHCSVIGSYLELQISDLVPFYMDGKVKHRPTTFIWTPRSKKAVSKSKLQEQRRSPKLSCSPDTIQCSTHILSSRSPNVTTLIFLHSFSQYIGKFQVIFFFYIYRFHQNFHQNFGRVSPIPVGPKLSTYTLFTLLITHIS